MTKSFRPFKQGMFLGLALVVIAMIVTMVLGLAGCSKQQPQMAPAQPGTMTVYHDSGNSLLWYYLLMSNGHSYYYSSTTYISPTNYASTPFVPVTPASPLPADVSKAVATEPVVEQQAVPEAQEPAIAEADIMAQQAAEIAAEQHADEAAEAATVTPTAPSEQESSTGTSESGGSSSDSGGGSSGD